ncbi:hypothetical protein D3C78_1177450 [compost metagenome]
MGDLARVVAEELQRHREYRGNLVVVGLELDIVGDEADIGGDLDAVAGDLRAERTDHLDQTGRQPHFLLRLAQGGADQVLVLGIAPPAGEGHFATVGGQTAGAQGQHQLRVVAAGDRHQHRRFGEVAIAGQGSGAMGLHALAQFVQHGAVSSSVRLESWHESPDAPKPSAGNRHIALSLHVALP